MSDTPPPPPPPAFHRPGALRRSPPVIAGSVTGALAKSSSILHNANPQVSSPLGTPVIPSSNGSGTDVGQNNTPTHTTRPKRRRLSKVPPEVQESAASASTKVVGKPQKPSQTSGWERRDRRAGVSSETGGSVGKGTTAPAAPGNLLLSGARGGDATEGRRGKKRSQEEPQYEEVLRARIEAIERANEKLRKEVEAERVRVEAQQRQQEQQFQIGEDQDQKYGEEDMIARLLAANDASLPAIPPTPAHAQPIWDFQLALAPTDDDIPSVKPLPFGLSELTAFSKLRFDSVVTVPIVTTTNDVNDSDKKSGALTTATTISGRAHGTKLWFRIVFHTTTIPAASPPRQRNTVGADAGADVNMKQEDDIFISSIPHISLPSWTRPELTPLLTHVTATNDLSHLLYSLDSYARVATQRASSWRQLHLPTAAPGRRVGVIPIEVARPTTKPTASRRTGKVELVVKWGIEIDDVGEARSCVEGEVRMPVAWKEAAGRGKAGEEEGVRRLGVLFKRLVKERGVVMAVKGVKKVLGGGEE